MDGTGPRCDFASTAHSAAGEQVPWVLIGSLMVSPAPRTDDKLPAPASCATSAGSGSPVPTYLGERCTDSDAWQVPEAERREAARGPLSRGFGAPGHPGDSGPQERAPVSTSACPEGTG